MNFGFRDLPFFCQLEGGGYLQIPSGEKKQHGYTNRRYMQDTAGVIFNFACKTTLSICELSPGLIGDLHQLQMMGK